MKHDWNEWMFVAYTNAKLSRDPSTQNGSVLIDANGQWLSNGVNNFPLGVKEHAERWERPTKYAFIEHAERSAIFNAAAKGIATRNTTLVCPWAACADCARAIVVAGVKKLVRVSNNAPHAGWDQSVLWGDEIMHEGGVDIVEIDYIHPFKTPEIQLLRNGELMEVK